MPYSWRVVATIITVSFNLISGDHPGQVIRQYYLSLDEFYGDPDGFRRLMYGFNHRSPGEQIYSNLGDRLIIYVTNNFSASAAGSAIHWHGIIQRGSNRMDGVPFVTQPLIFPGETFIYNFTVDDAGTFFYHAHYLEQYIQGLRGPLIVRDPAAASIYHDQVVFLADWYHSDADYLRDHMYLNPMSMGMEPVPDSGLINGVGQNRTCHIRSSCKYSITRATKLTSLCGSFIEYADILEWQQLRMAAAIHAKRINNNNDGSESAVDSYEADDDDADYKITKLRVINGGSFAVYNFSVDNHVFWVLELDGQPVIPQRTNNFLINSGQRIDVALCRKSSSNSSSNSSSDNGVSTKPSVRDDLNTSDNCNSPSVWIRAVMVQKAFMMPSSSPGVLGILQYGHTQKYGRTHTQTKNADAAADSDEVFQSTPSNAHRLPQSGPATLCFQYNTGTNSISGSGSFNFDPYKLNPDVKQYSESMYPPPAATKTVPIRIDFYKNSRGVMVAHFNHISMETFTMDDKGFVPLIDRIARGQTLPESNNSTNDMNIVTYNTTDVVELVIDNYNDMEHPLHFHGRRVYVIARGEANDGAYNVSLHAGSYVNNENPILRDTVTINSNSFLIVRFADRNPGIWIMHCHVDWHEKAGMAMLFHEVDNLNDRGTPVFDEQGGGDSSTNTNIGDALPHSRDVLTPPVIIGIWILIAIVTILGILYAAAYLKRKRLQPHELIQRQSPSEGAKTQEMVDLQSFSGAEIGDSLIPESGGDNHNQYSGRGNKNAAAHTYSLLPSDSSTRDEVTNDAAIKSSAEKHAAINGTGLQTGLLARLGGMGLSINTARGTTMGSTAMYCKLPLHSPEPSPSGTPTSARATTSTGRNTTSTGTRNTTSTSRNTTSTARSTTTSTGRTVSDIRNYAAENDVDDDVDAADDDVGSNNMVFKGEGEWV